MGEYYFAIILSAANEILAIFEPLDYGSGMKWGEHQFIDDPFMNAVESYLYENRDKQMRVVWLGDGATTFTPFKIMTPKELDEKRVRNQTPLTTSCWIVNHTKKQSIYIEKPEKDIQWHPLACNTCVDQYSNSLNDTPWFGDFITVAL